jgi:hypothetical protein
MRQLTIAERHAAAVLLPLAAMVSVQFLTAALMAFLDEANATFAEIFTAFVITNVADVVVLLVARGTMRPLAQVADTLDAIVYAELVSVTPLQPARGEIARLERDDEVVEVTVLDIGEGGALIDIVENVAIGDHVVLTFLGVKAITAEAVRSGGDGFGICFKPACLRLEDLCDLVTSQERAA